MDAESEALEPRCPTCRRPLICIGNGEISLIEPDFRSRHAYWCPAGCRGPEPDGSFELIECPACGSHDTVSMLRGDGVEELECHACGSIMSLQIVP